MRKLPVTDKADPTFVVSYIDESGSDGGMFDENSAIGLALPVTLKENGVAIIGILMVAIALTLLATYSRKKEVAVK